MTWIINWNGRDYNVDPTEFSGLELKMVKERTGFNLTSLCNALAREQDGDALRVLFWVVDRRDNQELKFTDYHGPSLSVVIPHLDGLNASLDALTGDLGKARTQTTETSGGPTSPSSTPPTETGTYTTD